MPLLNDIADGLTKIVTGSSTSDLQAQAAAAEQQITLAVQTVIILEAIVVTELVVIALLLYKAGK